MDRAISLTAYSWVWAHGQTGAIATAGVVIASAVVAEEGMSVPGDTPVDSAHRLYALAGLAGMPPLVALMPRRHAVTRLMPRRHAVTRPIPRQRVVVNRVVVVNRTAANALAGSG